jgi:hypothetical protein
MQKVAKNHDKICFPPPRLPNARILSGPPHFLVGVCSGNMFLFVTGAFPDFP